MIEQDVKASAVDEMRALDEKYAAWMVSVHYRAEPNDLNPSHRLPRPAGLAIRNLQAADSSKQGSAEDERSNVEVDQETGDIDERRDERR